MLKSAAGVSLDIENGAEMVVVVAVDEEWSVEERPVGEWRQLVCRNGKRLRPPYREWRQRVCRQLFELL